jgi:hypothetical protein
MCHINAAKNLEQLAVGYMERINACGVPNSALNQENIGGL